MTTDARPVGPGPGSGPGPGPATVPSGPDPARVRWMGEVVEAWEGRLVAYAHRHLGDVERARDVVQDTFLRLWQQDDAARRDLAGHEGPWLYRTCRNRALDILRKERRMHVTSEAGAIADAGAASATADGDAGPRHVLDLVHRLPARQQEAVRLRFQGGLAYREIAEVMDTTVTNVGVLLHTAIRRLREWADAPPQAGGAS